MRWRKNKETNDVIEQLILAGAIEVAGVEEGSGELLYVFTPKMKDVSPLLYRDHLNFVNGEIMALWEKGFVNVDLLSEEPVVTLTQKAFIPDAIDNLSKQQRWSLEEIKRLLKKREV
jgi:hypothetical protein